MAQEIRTGTDRRSQSRSDVSALILSRSDTLSRYADLASHRPYNENDKFSEELKKFCQAIIDYTASAHFQLYQHLDENKERRQPVMIVANEVYSAISKTTDLILTFNDRYGDGADISAHMNHIEHDLSSLGEALADRISNEDMIIDAMLCERRSA